MAASSSQQKRAALRPLGGVRVVETGSSVAAAFAGKLLADLGAEVIKIEPRSGDRLRRQAPFMEGGGDEQVSALFGYLSGGKRCVGFDLDTSTGCEVATPIIERANLLLWVSDDPSTAAIKPLLDKDRPGRPATIAFSPFGLTGIRAGRIGTAFIAQHSGGLAYHQAYPVGDPNATPPTGAADREADMIVGLVAANAAMWALLASEKDGRKPFVDLAAEDTFAYLLVDALADLKEGRLTPSRKRLPEQGITIAGGLIWFLPCAKGAIMVSPREDHQWARWMELMGQPVWATDASLCGSRAARTKNSSRLQVLMAEWSVHQDANTVFAKAQAARVACFPVSTAADLINNEQLHARQFFDTLTSPGKRGVAMPGLPFQMRSSSGAVLARGRMIELPMLIAPSVKGNADA